MMGELEGSDDLQKMMGNILGDLSKNHIQNRYF
jgi:hypothetical protein